MVVEPFQKHFKSDPVVKIFTRMNFKTDIDTSLVEGVEDGMPAFGQFIECGFNQVCGSLGPGVEIGPGQSRRFFEALAANNI